MLDQIGLSRLLSHPSPRNPRAIRVPVQCHLAGDLQSKLALPAWPCFPDVLYQTTLPKLLEQLFAARKG